LFNLTFEQHCREQPATAPQGSVHYPAPCLSKGGNDRFKPNFPLDRKFVIPAKAGIQMIKKPCEAGQNKGVDRCAK
jgi:hypothetical protein